VVYYSDSIRSIDERDSPLYIQVNEALISKHPSESVTHTNPITGYARLKSRTAQSLREVRSQLSSAGSSEAVPVLTYGSEQRHQGASSRAVSLYFVARL
jgi:hypothetical protein